MRLQQLGFENKYFRGTDDYNLIATKLEQFTALKENWDPNLPGSDAGPVVTDNRDAVIAFLKKADTEITELQERANELSEKANDLKNWLRESTKPFNPGPKDRGTTNKKEVNDAVVATRIARAREARVDQDLGV